jgi:ABC-2 type transport system ATP-binding protein
VDGVLEQVGLAGVARRRVKTYSLGMRQRLGIAAALLGDPAVLLFDEPVNGLDADGVRWVRHLVRELASEGRTVLVSSHLMSEMQQTADHLIVIAGGRLIADSSIEDVLNSVGNQHVRVRTTDQEAMRRGLSRVSSSVQMLDDGALIVTGASTQDIGAVARAANVTLFELTEHGTSLEEAYLELTGASDYETKTDDGSHFDDRP